jgi:hypothetical protein
MGWDRGAARAVSPGGASTSQDDVVSARGVGRWPFPAWVSPRHRLRRNQSFRPGALVRCAITWRPLQRLASLCAAFGLESELSKPTGSSLGVVQRTPLHRHGDSESTPGCPGLWVATPRARSALAVPPGFDGFRLAGPCRLVASCSRSWGSPGFEPTRDQCRSTVPEPDPPRRRMTLRSVSLLHEWNGVTPPK